ncbi:hypothetical protein DFH09DRAFT_1088848 [Mycena vulgaris]|nr:hypothetical protein DFH09DRAFT_1088848 [Mycena vulgaris]
MSDGRTSTDERESTSCQSIKSLLQPPRNNWANDRTTYGDLSLQAPGAGRSFPVDPEKPRYQGGAWTPPYGPYCLIELNRVARWHGGAIRLESRPVQSLCRGPWWASLQVFPYRRVRGFKLSVASTEAPVSQLGSCISLTHSFELDATSTHEFLVRRRSLGYSKNGASSIYGWRRLRWFFRWAVLLAILMEVSCDPSNSRAVQVPWILCSGLGEFCHPSYSWVHRLLASIEPP